MVQRTIYKVGNTYETPQGKILILDKTPAYKSADGKHHHTRATIKFVETGWVANVQTTNIKQGKIRDFRKPTVYGVGYLDTDIKIPMRGNGIVRRMYDLWANMLKRCYGGYKTCYQGCTVDVRWHSFKNFMNSLPQIEGYEKWEKDSSMHLDKDIKGNGTKVYSLDTCKFITGSENTIESLNRRWGKK